MIGLDFVEVDDIFSHPVMIIDWSRKRFSGNHMLSRAEL